MRKNECLSLAAAAGVLLTVQAQATTWNATDDFSLAANPNGAWSYAYYGAGVFGGLMPNSNANWFGPDVAAWGTGGPASVPCVMKNNSGAAIYGWAPGVLGIHPGAYGSSYENALVIWTAPAKGFYRFTSSFTYVGPGSGVVPTVAKNLGTGGVNLTQKLITQTDPVLIWNETMSLLAGDMIIWGENSNGDNASDSTVLSAEVTTVPTGVWDANTDFSVAANPNGAWSYEWVNPSSGTRGLMPNSSANWFATAVAAWGTGGAGTIPCVMKNNSGAAIYGWEPGVLGMHPAGSTDAVIRWTAPSNGVYQVSASAKFVGNVNASDGVDVSICRNLAGSLAGSLWAANVAVGTAAYHDGVYSLTNGESLALVLGMGGNDTGDSTTVEFTVTPLPLATPVLWDARADFSATTNANVNGVWSYEWANSTNGTTGLMPNSSPDWFGAGYAAWGTGDVGSVPVVAKNNSGATIGDGVPGKLGVHPADNRVTSNIRWTAPYDGEFQFAAAWTRLNSAGDRVDASVHTNFTGSLAGSLWTGYSNCGVPARWSGTRKLKAGESVTFLTGDGGAGIYTVDYTQVDIFVSLLSRPKGTLIRVY